MSIRFMEKEIPGSHYFSFFALSNLLTQTCLHFHRTGQLTSSDHAKCTFILIYYYICLHVPTYCILMQLISIKWFSLVYLNVSVVRQRN